MIRSPIIYLLNSLATAHSIRLVRGSLVHVSVSRLLLLALRKSSRTLMAFGDHNAYIHVIITQCENF
jgi:hypothetical protein